MNCLLIYVPWQKAANFDHVRPDPCKIDLNVNGNTPGKIKVKKKNKKIKQFISSSCCNFWGNTENTK